MAIRCGCCGGEHATAGEVRACCAGASPQAVLPVDPPRPAAPPVDAAGPTRPAAAWAGPEALGRSLVVRPGAPVPPPWAHAPRLRIDAGTLADPAAMVAQLRPEVLARRRLVLELEVALDEPAVVEGRPPHQLGPGFELALDALHHLVWSNSVDGRDPDAARWPWADRAVDLGAHPEGPADVVLADGTPAWCDGGPLWHRTDLGAVVARVALEHGSLRPLGPSTVAAELAPDQAAAVAHPGGGARVIAPAGSGKTRVLTERARLLLGPWGLPASAVCLVAFNKRAQEEMVARTTDVAALRVRTLNALGLAILNGDRPFAPQPRRLATLDEVDVRRLLGRMVQLPKRRNVDPLATWLEALTVARLGLRDPVAVERDFDGDVPGFADVCVAYRQRLRDAGQLDFDEQVLGAVELLLTDPATRRVAQRACRLLLVDEFQDLTPAHLLLVRLLAAPGYEVLGVGDDDQTIYGYNGADPAWLIDFARYFPGAADHPLEVNYRCPPDVVAGAATLLRHNRRRVPKVVRAAKSGPPGLRLVASGDPPTAAVTAVTDLLEGGAAPADVAVLARVNVVLAPVQVALGAAGVPVRATIGPELLDRTAVRATLAWLALATGRWSPDALREVLRRPSRSLSPRVAEWVAEQTDPAGLARLGARLRSERDADAVAGLAVDLATLTRLAGTTRAALDHLFGPIGLAPAVSGLDRTRHGRNATAQADDLEALRWLAGLQPDAAAFEPWLREVLSRPSHSSGVTLASVHRVKGQEWPHVVVHDASATQFPHRLADDVEEERRVFHVAVTRAIRTATIVVPDPPSPFVAQLSSEPDLSAPAPTPPSRAQAEAPKPRRTAPAAPATPAGKRAVDLLKSLRRELADGKPAYTVFDDTTLHLIAEALPSSLADLGRIRGIGPARLQAYGERILATVARARDPVP